MKRRVGDGATSTGAFHEAVNIAAVEKLPLVIAVANNRKLAARMAAKERADAEAKQAAAEEKLRAAQTESERAADANRAEADRLAAERAAIDAERKRIDDDAARITAAQRATMEEELRKRDDALKAAEKRAADATRAIILNEKLKLKSEIGLLNKH